MITLPQPQSKSAPKDGKTQGQKHLQNALFILAGSALNAIAIALFFEPFYISPGGISGIAIVLSHYTPLSVGVGIILMNSPLVVITWIKLGWRIIFSTAVTILLSSVAIDLLAAVPSPVNETIFAAFFGGVFIGAGMGLVFRGQATTGGTSIMGKLINHYKPHLKIGLTIMLLDGVIVVTNALVFRDFSLVIYAMIALYLAARVMDAILR